MRILATSDIHIDYKSNLKLIRKLSNADYIDDILLLAGDISHLEDLLKESFEIFKKKFKEVVFVPGNHDLWTYQTDHADSWAKYRAIQNIARDFEVITYPFSLPGAVIIPVLAWYDFSFGKPAPKLLKRWNDFRYCRWPEEKNMAEVTTRFLQMNDLTFDKQPGQQVITVSHFMPRADLIPSFLRVGGYFYAPVLGTKLIDQLVRKLNSTIHVYGHSHINVDKKRRGINYINNALGYPSESDYTLREMKTVLEI